jgi:transposase-like protein
VGERAARLQAPRHDRSGVSGRRRGAGVLEGPAGCIPRDSEQRCWWHKIADVLAALPKSAHPGAKKALAEIYNAENRDRAAKAARAFAADYGTKWPQAGGEDHRRPRRAAPFFDIPAEHWVHLRTTNPIESTFATVRHGSTSQRDPAPGPPGSR